MDRNPASLGISASAIPSSGLFHRDQEPYQSADRTELLHASQKAHRKRRTHRRCDRSLDWSVSSSLSMEHLDELGDLCRKRLIMELMGKHSNIIFCDEDGTDLGQHQACLRPGQLRARGSAGPDVFHPAHHR
ncbi:MAG: NFACT family protein [Clostridium sp.]